MKKKTKDLFGAFATFAVGAFPIFGGDGAPSARQIFDKQLSAVESEVMGVVETMPADKFDFAPTQGAFKTARTFGVQARHIAFCSMRSPWPCWGSQCFRTPIRKGQGM